MKKINRRQVYFGIFWVILITSFLFFASLLVLIANGYHLNYSNFKLEKTGMIVLNGSTEPIQVTINGKSSNVALPIKFSQLFPGSYQLKIEKDGYFGIYKSFQISGGQAVIINDIDLVKRNINVVEVPSDEKAINRIKSENLNQTKQFVLKDNEIWRDNKLVTRFSQKVIGAIFDSSTNQYFVQLSDGVHMILLDGSNDNLILKMANSEPVIMTINGNNLLYLDTQNKVYQAPIR